MGKRAQKNPDPKIGVNQGEVCYLMILGSQSPQDFPLTFMSGIGLRSIISRVDSSHWASLRFNAS